MDVLEGEFTLTQVLEKFVQACLTKVSKDVFFFWTFVFFDFEKSKFSCPDFFAEAAGLYDDARLHPLAEFLLGLDGLHHFEPFRARFLAWTL